MAKKTTAAARKQPQQSRAQGTVEAILLAAARVLIRDGLEGATTNHIAERAGVSVGSLYQYFPNKEAIVFALVERHVVRMQRELEEATVTLAESPIEEAIPAYVRAMLAAHRVEPKLHRVFSEQLPKLAGRELFQRWSDQSEAIIRSYLELHRKQLRPVDLNLAAFMLLHAVEAITHAVVILRPRYLESETLAQEVSQLVLRYLGVPDKSSGAASDQV